MAQQTVRPQAKPSKQPSKGKQQQAPNKANASEINLRPDIEGWGSDLNRDMRPAVPMERTPPRFVHVHWDEIEQQPIQIKVFHSLERPQITPIFGTSAPPKWVSGQIRDVAYRLTENDFRHWLLLLLADRVDMIEGVVEDLSRGYVPNIFSEMGIKAEIKHNKVGLAKKLVVATGVLGLAGLWMMNRRQRRQNFDSQWAAGSEI